MVLGSSTDENSGIPHPNEYRVVGSSFGSGALTFDLDLFEYSTVSKGFEIAERRAIRFRGVQNLDVLAPTEVQAEFDTGFLGLLIRVVVYVLMLPIGWIVGGRPLFGDERLHPVRELYDAGLARSMGGASADSLERIYAVKGGYVIESGQTGNCYFVEATDVSWCAR